MIRKWLLVPIVLSFAACAAQREAAAPPKTAPKAEVAAPQNAAPASEPAAQPEHRVVHLDLQLLLPGEPNSWKRAPSPSDDPGDKAFVNKDQTAVVIIHLQRQEDANAHKVTQIMALAYTMHGMKPLDLVPDEGGNHAYLTLQAETDKGPLFTLVDVRPSSFDPDVYQIVTCMWFAPSLTPDDLAKYRHVADSVKLTAR